MTTAITTTLRQQTYPKTIPYAEIAQAMLGKKYELSLVFCGDSLSRRLNRQSRGKDKATDVLSFGLDDHEGEIFINLNKVRSQQKAFGRDLKNLTAYFFIHGCAHLKGYDHGATMDAYEQRIRRRFGIDR